MTAPRTPIIEAKVKTSAAAAAAVGLVLALLSQYVFHGEVPSVVGTMVATVVSTLVTGGITFLVGWLTRHTPRDVVDIRIDED